MSLPGNSILVTPGSGATVATQTVSSKDYQVIMLADQDGHIQGSAAAYQLVQMPRVTTAAATDFFDLFNATGSGKIIRIRGLYPTIEITAASAIIPTFRFDVFRTSAVGTGGTAHTFEGASAPATGALQIARFSTNDAPTLSASITSRSLPTGGATAACYLYSIQLQSEETNASTTLVQGINMMTEMPLGQPWELQENQGIKVRQITATASTGTNLGWIMTFAVIP
jgi:hypothetical protein